MPPVRTDADQSGGYAVAAVEYDAGPDGDFRLLDITQILPRLMMEDDDHLDQAAGGWQALGQQFFEAASVLRASMADLAGSWRSDSATALADRVDGAARSLDAWGYVAVDRAYELADLATSLRAGKSRLEQLWAEFHRSAGALLTPPTDLTLAQRSEWRAQAAGAPALEVNVRTYTQRALDDVVNPLANRFSEAALAFTVAGPVYAGPTNAAVPSDAALAALLIGSWLPDSVAAPPAPALPAAPALRSAPAVPEAPALPAAPILPIAPAPSVPVAPGTGARVVGGPGAAVRGPDPWIPVRSAPASLLGRQAAGVRGLPILPSMPSMPSMSSMPSGSSGPVASWPDLPGRLGLPARPDLPGPPGRSDAPVRPDVPGLPGTPARPGPPGSPAAPRPPSPPGGSGMPRRPGAPASHLEGRSGAPGTPPVPPPPGGRRRPATPPQLGGRTTRTPAAEPPRRDSSTPAPQLRGRGTACPEPPASQPPALGQRRAPEHERPGMRPAAHVGPPRPRPVEQPFPGTIGQRPSPALGQPSPGPSRAAPAREESRPVRPTRGRHAAPEPDVEPLPSGPSDAAIAPTQRGVEQGGTEVDRTGLGGRAVAAGGLPTPAEHRAADRARRRAEWDAARREHRLTPSGG